MDYQPGISIYAKLSLLFGIATFLTILTFFSGFLSITFMRIVVTGGLISILLGVIFSLIALIRIERDLDSLKGVVVARLGLALSTIPPVLIFGYILYSFRNGIGD